MRSEYCANRALARNARLARIAPRNNKGRFLKPRQGNVPGLNAWLIWNEVVAR
jgi:hypothetical protein